MSKSTKLTLPSKPSTMAEVAKLSGVSTATVSRIINNADCVSGDTRDRVMDAIKRLNYRPNINARGLAGDRSFLVGLFIEDPGSYARDIQRGMTERCLGSGLHLMVESLNGDDPKIAKLVSRILSQLRLEAAVLLPPHCDNQKILQILIDEGIPFIQVSPRKPHPMAANISVDDYNSARLMTKYLLECGHTNIAFMAGKPGHKAADERYAGFVAEMTASGVAINPDLVVCGKFTFDGGLDAARQMLNVTPRPTAILTCGDDMAVAVLSVAQQLGVRLPGELSVTGFDDSPIAQMVWPRLTTVRQPVYDIGVAAVDLILKFDPRKQGWPQSPPSLMLDFEIVVRESTEKIKSGRKTGSKK